MTALLLFPLLMVGAAVSDLFTMTIPNKLVLGLSAGFLIAAAQSGLGLEAATQHAAASLVVLAVGFGLFAVGWIGGGDAKLAAATALWLGFDVLLDYVLLAALAGGILTVLILLARAWPLPAFAIGWEWVSRLHDRRSGIPYGIALAAAALVVFPSSALWRMAIGA